MDLTSGPLIMTHLCSLTHTHAHFHLHDVQKLQSRNRLDSRQARFGTAAMHSTLNHSYESTIEP